MLRHRFQVAVRAYDCVGAAAAAPSVMNPVAGSNESSSANRPQSIKVSNRAGP